MSNFMKTTSLLFVLMTLLALGSTSSAETKLVAQSDSKAADTNPMTASLNQAERQLRELLKTVKGEPTQVQVRARRQASSSQQGQGLFGLLGELGPQVEKAQSSMKMLSSIFSSSPAPSGANPQAPPTGGAPNATASTGQLLSQLTELARATQERSAKALSGAQQTNQEVAAVASQNAQGGIQAALSEIGQGLQRIAANNPSLLPDVKSLYQSVSTKLSSASSSAGQAAEAAAAAAPTNLQMAPAKSGGEQLADSLAKLASGSS